MTVDAFPSGLGPFCESVLAVMPDAIVGTDPEDRVILWNAAAERLYGCSAAEAMGRLAQDVIADVGPTTADVLDDDGLAIGGVRILRHLTERGGAGPEHLWAVVAASQDFIGMSDLEGRPFFLNEAGRRMVGLSDDEDVRELHISAFVAPEAHELLREELMPRVLAVGRETRELAFVDFRTGERIPVSWDAFRIDDPETGQPVALATITRDLREGQTGRAEIIARYERRVDTVLASITDAFYGLDQDFRFIYLNDRAVEVLSDLLGEDLSREDFLGNEVFAMFPGIVDSDTEHNFRLARAENRSITYEYLYPPRARWFDIRVYPTAEGVAVYFTEITDRKAADAARQRHTRQQAAVAELGVRSSRVTDVVELMEEAAAVVSRTLEVELVAVAEVVSGASEVVLRAGVGWEPGVITSPNVVASADSLSGRAVATEAPVVVADIRLEEPHSTSALLLANGVTSAAVVPVMGERSPFGAVGVFSRAQRLFDADEVNFLRAIAHVLQSAIERTELAQRVRDVRDAERRRLARALHDETLQELGLALARASSPTSRTGAVDHELVAMIKRVGEQVRGAIHDLRLGESSDELFPAQVATLVDRHRPGLPHVDCVVSEDLPEHPPRDTAANVLRVLGEALTNVSRHASASRVDVRVGVDERTLVAAVHDDGRGIDALERPGRSGGHGIPGMLERAELLGGELRVQSPPDGGTLVELRVPMARRPRADRTRVLLVDDHAAIREAIALAFARDDEFVVTGQAGSLAEARELLDDADIAIVDLDLPDGDGTDLIEELRARDPRVQTLVLSAHVDRADIARAVQKGAAAVLGKTTHLHEVVAAVRRLQAGETLMPLDEVVELLRFEGRRRERELGEQRRIETLSPREREVLQLLAMGLDGASIARRLYISPRTERNHVANILAKLEVHSQLQAVVFALRHGLVEVPAATDEI